MPLYDFDCRACGRRFEALVRSHDRATACPGCGATDLERLPSSFAVSSADSRQASATKARQKAAAEGRRETAARHREAETHRREDH
ncbi:MAG TPA: zinc ribbon domain-containing protein [Vicinamibacterales bacterium]|nr:zinc ribbon domain-containing protein [Vicinamibacterales bacterium]